MLRDVLVFGGTKSLGLELMRTSRGLSQGHKCSRETGERDEETGINELDKKRRKGEKSLNPIKDPNSQL